MQLLVAIRRKTRKKVIEVHYGHDIIFITPFKHFVVPTFSISYLAWFYILLFELNMYHLYCCQHESHHIGVVAEYSSRSFEI